MCELFIFATLHQETIELINDPSGGHSILENGAPSVYFFWQQAPQLIVRLARTLDKAVPNGFQSSMNNECFSEKRIRKGLVVIEIPDSAESDRIRGGEGWEQMWTGVDVSATALVSPWRLGVSKDLCQRTCA